MNLRYFKVEDDGVIMQKSDQRFAAPGEPTCVVCGRYGAYICDKVEYLWFEIAKPIRILCVSNQKNICHFTDRGWCLQYGVQRGTLTNSCSWKHAIKCTGKFKLNVDVWWLLSLFCFLSALANSYSACTTLLELVKFVFMAFVLPTI